MMKKLIYCLLILHLSLGAVLQAQTYKKKTIGGKEFYQYQVEKSEGYYSINKKFGVTEEELLLYNPELKDGLKAGQTIYVPVYTNQVGMLSSPITASTPTTGRGFIEHLVERGQTVYSISQLYHINIDTIYKYNPESVNKLRKGSIIKVPVTSIKKDEIKREIDNNNYVMHTVLAQQTLYSISRLYDVPVSSLIELNPDLKTRSLREGEIIRVNLKSTVKPISSSGTAINAKNSVLKVAFLLPFMLDAQKHDPAADKFFDFYQGALVAVDSLKNAGVSVNIYTYDTDRNSDKIKQILTRPELRNVDLIIGPAYTDQVKTVSNFAKANKIKLLVPFSPKIDETANNESVFLFNTPQEILNEEIIRIFIDKFKSQNIIVLTFQDSPAEIVRNFSDSLTRKLKVNNIAFIEKKVPNDSITTYSIEKYLVPNKENVVALMTISASNLAKIMPSLNKTDKEFSLFGFQEWTQQAKTQDELYVHNTYICSPFFMDFKDKGVRRFFTYYLNAFGNETSLKIPYYNVLGYDLTFYFLSGLNKFGTAEFERNLDNINVKTLQAGFKFRQLNNKGGYVNMHSFLINYKDEIKVKLQ